MPVEFPAILGRDLAGEVVEAGRSVTGFNKGMRVMALANGTYAECTVAKADVLAPIPDALSFEQAAALPLVTLTGAQLIARGVKAKEKEVAAGLLVDGVVGIDDEAEVAKLRDLDAIADTVGGTAIQRLLKAVRSGGELGSVRGKPEGAEKYGIHAEAIMAVPDASRLFELADDVARQEFTIPIARTMRIEEIQEAHRLAEKGGVKGKIVLIS